MNPSQWGPYGWRMIHAFSRLPVSLGAYRSWLEATVGVLPCRKCRKNFQRHLDGVACKSPKTPAELSIFLHEEVSKDLGKRGKDAQPGVWKPTDLPEPNPCNLIQPFFWMTLASNTLERKNTAIERWLQETAGLLEKTPHESLGKQILDFKGSLMAPGGALALMRNLDRRRRMAEQIRGFLESLKLHAPSQAELRRKFDKIPPSSTSAACRSRATRKRTRADKRTSRSSIKSRARNTAS